jgi:hypothetical protein
MRPGERLLRLLWVLLLVPMLGVLGLDLQRLHHGSEQTVDRAPLTSLDATRREPGKVNPGQAHKTKPPRGRGNGNGFAVLPPPPDLAVYGPGARELLPPASLGAPHHHARRWPWQARGPPLA